MTKGVIYYNRGRKCVVRLIVSMMTLRKHYQGPITLFLDDKGFGKENMSLLTKDVKREFDVDVITDENEDTTTYVRAVEVCMKAPYDLNLWMDADTVILGNIDEILIQAETHDLSIAHFAKWKTRGGTISSRINALKDIVPQYMEAAIDYGPAINCGIYGFPKNSKILKEWLWLSKRAESIHTFIPDEKSCQVLLPQYDVSILPTKYNVSVIHDPDYLANKGKINVFEIARKFDWRVLHAHGRKHCKDFPVCELWIKEFIECLEENTCHIRSYVGKEYGDRRLRGFLKGKYGWKRYRRKANRLIDGPPKETQPVPAAAIANPAPAIILDDNDEIDPALVTLVTACDPKYIEALKYTYPNWKKYKGIDRYPAIVFINGMEPEDPRLDFLRADGVKLIPWSMPNAEDHREEMLSAFVLGTAKHVKTPYWLKIDADSYATDDRPLLQNWMKDYAFCGHKWGYSWAKHVKALDQWAAGHNMKKLSSAPPMYDQSCASGRRYNHPEKRTISFVQLQSTAFTKLCSDIAGGKRLPVPSHDTYLFYMAKQLGEPYRGHNFKRKNGFTQANGRRGGESVRRKMEEKGLLV